MNFSFFDGSTIKRKPIYGRIDGFQPKEIGLNSREDSSHREKLYRLKECFVRFTKRDGDDSWVKGAHNAIFDFIVSNDIFEDRVKVVEISYPNRDNHGIVIFQCYVREGARG